MSSISSFIKKHLIFKNTEILVIFVIIFFYRLTFSLFSFSILRFLAHALNRNFVFIGLAMAISNAIALLIDIPLGISQKYIKPRYFILLAVLLLLISDMIFLMSASNYLLAFLAILFYQLSVEVFFITIVTYILRLSGEKDSTQNVAQSDIVSNSGQMAGMVLGGILFSVDKFLNTHDSVVIIALLCLTTALFFIIYEFADNRHHSKLEEYILNQKMSQKILGAAHEISETLITKEGPASNESANISEEAEMKKEKPVDFHELGQKIIKAMKETFGVFISVVKNPLGAPLLIWIMVIIMITTFWNEALGFFEPFFLKFLYQGEVNIVTQNISRYIFESGMLLAALVIPTFVFEYPLSRLADKWGKHKVILLCTLASGLGLLLLSIFSRTYTFFFLYLVVGIAYVGIYPSMVSLINEEYQKINRKNKAMVEKGVESKTEVKKENEEDEGSEGMSAALLSILMNFGQISSGVLGGILLSVLDFKVIFFLLGGLLLMIGAGSWIFLLKFRETYTPSP